MLGSFFGSGMVEMAYTGHILAGFGVNAMRCSTLPALSVWCRSLPVLPLQRGRPRVKSCFSLRTVEHATPPLQEGALAPRLYGLEGQREPGLQLGAWAGWLLHRDSQGLNFGLGHQSPLVGLGSHLCAPQSQFYPEFKNTNLCFSLIQITNRSLAHMD